MTGPDLERKVKYLGGHLMMKKEYGDMILEGRKTSTIRLGYIIPKKKEIIIHSGGRPIAKAVIDEVIHKKLSELDDEDVVREGYNSKKELFKELRKIYGKNISKDSVVTIIRFHLTERLDHLDFSKPYMGLKPRDIAALGLRYLNSELLEEEKKILQVLRETGSIRKTAYKIYGTVEKRFNIRLVLKKVIEKLVMRGILEISTL
ncbi:MAG: ASCH domain-containing protein [Sulfolobales archaeon]